MPISPTEDDILGQLGDALRAMLPGVLVIQGQVNRVPEPIDGECVVMQPPNFLRLRTNVDTSTDCRFTASIAGTTMTVTDVDYGTIAVGATVFGENVTADTVVSAIVTPGSVYTVSKTQTVASEVMASGQKTMELASDVSVQLEFHSTTGSSGDYAQTVATYFRDESGVDLFERQIPDDGVRPLYADGPRQVPFFNEEQQAEYRWQLEAHVQANQVVTVPQQFADIVSLETISIDPSASSTIVVQESP